MAAAVARGRPAGPGPAGNTATISALNSAHNGRAGQRGDEALDALRGWLAGNQRKTNVCAKPPRVTDLTPPRRGAVVAWGLRDWAFSAFNAEAAAAAAAEGYGLTRPMHKS